MAAKLTMKLARELAVKLFGTAKGLKKSGDVPGKYEMRLGQFLFEIALSRREYGLLEVRAFLEGQFEFTHFYDPDTLERNYSSDVRSLYETKREYLTRWVDERGAERCKAEIDKIAARYD